MRLLIRLVALGCLVAAPAQAIGPQSLAESGAGRAEGVDWLRGALRPAQGYDCRDVACSRLRSCEEACYKLLVCGQSKRDGDNDGIPCENLCSRPCR